MMVVQQIEQQRSRIEDGLGLVYTDYAICLRNGTIHFLKQRSDLLYSSILTEELEFNVC